MVAVAVVSLPLAVVTHILPLVVLEAVAQVVQQELQILVVVVVAVEEPLAVQALYASDTGVHEPL
jgi:hypothetical protein